MMMMSVLKLLITSLGTPFEVNMVLRVLAVFPRPLSFRFWMGKKRKIPHAWKVRRTSSIKASFYSTSNG